MAKTTEQVTTFGNWADELSALCGKNRTSLRREKSLSAFTVDLKAQQVELTHGKEVDLKPLLTTLAQLGYPAKSIS